MGVWKDSVGTNSAAGRDFIKRASELLVELLIEARPTFSETIAAEFERRLHREFAGERVYIPKRNQDLRERIVAGFNGHHVNDLIRDLGVSRTTIYRAIREARVQTSISKKRAKFAVNGTSHKLR